MRNSTKHLLALALVVFLLIPLNANAHSIDSVQFQLSVLTGSPRIVTEQDVLSGELDSYFTSDVYTKLNVDSKDLWLKVDAENPSSVVEWGMIFDPSLTLVKVYEGGGVKQTGTNVPMSERDVKTGENIVKVRLDPNNKNTFYIFLEREGSLTGLSTIEFVPFNKWQESYLLSRVSINLELGLFLGVCLFAFIALVFLFINTKDKSYLYYGLYLLFAAFYTIGGFGYIWFIIGEIPATFWVIESFILIGCYLSFFKFLRHYFSLRKEYPFWSKVFWGIDAMLVLMLLNRLFFPEWEGTRSLILATVLLTTIVFFIHLIIRKNPIVMYVFGGTMAFAGSLLLAIVLHNFGIKFFLDFNALAMIGVFAQIVLFSIGMANRMQLIIAESQRTKDAFIKQLEENQKIQQEINDQLEKRVRLRTKEISRQKEEIHKKAQQLEKVNEEVKQLNENLELEVLKRTEHIKLQNKKLIDYAFRNAHHIRGPLARILGLLYLIKKDKGNDELHDFYLDRLEASAVELDNSIKKSSKLLEEEENLHIESNREGV